MYKYGFQPSSILPAKFLINVICEGLFGIFKRENFASSGVLLPFLLLHFIQAVVRFSQESSPPLDFGITWSTVRFEVTPQYWHLWLSLLNIFFRERIIFLNGTLTKNTSLTILGYSKLRLTVYIFFASRQYIDSALPK